VPRTRLELEAPSGVGRKTANVVLNTAFGEPTIAVDTHFSGGERARHRRLKKRRRSEDKLLKAVPDESSSTRTTG